MCEPIWMWWNWTNTRILYGKQKWINMVMTGHLNKFAHSSFMHTTHINNLSKLRISIQGVTSSWIKWILPTSLCPIIDTHRIENRPKNKNRAKQSVNSNDQKTLCERNQTKFFKKKTECELYTSKFYRRSSKNISVFVNKGDKKSYYCC